MRYLRHAGRHVRHAAVDIEHPVDRRTPPALVARPAAVEAGRAVAAEAGAQHDVAGRVGRIEGVEIDDLRRSIIRCAAAVVALGRRAARRRSLLRSGAEGGQRDVDRRRRAHADFHCRGRRFERLLDDADVVGARRQVEDPVAAVLRVDGVGDAVDRVVRLDAQGAHVAVVGRYAAGDHARGAGVLGDRQTVGQHARSGEQHRSGRHQRRAGSNTGRRLDMHETSPFGPRVGESQRSALRRDAQAAVGPGGTGGMDRRSNAARIAHRALRPEHSPVGEVLRFAPGDAEHPGRNGSFLRRQVRLQRDGKARGGFRECAAADGRPPEVP